jgi:hypothetical protein
LGIDEGKLTVDLPTDLGGIGVAMMKWVMSVSGWIVAMPSSVVPGSR